MTTTLKNTKICIEKLNFDIVGKMSLKLKDGRVIIVPLKYFPDIQKLSVEKRKKYTIVDDRTVLFSYSDSVYHLEDFMGLENKWKDILELKVVQILITLFKMILKNWTKSVLGSMIFSRLLNIRVLC